MKYRDVLQKAVVFVVSICLLLSLAGCDGQSEPDTDPSENQIQPAEDQEPSTMPYREFYAEDFLSGDVLTGGIQYIGADEGGDTSTVGNTVMINYKREVFGKNFSNVIRDNGATWETIKKCLEDDWFNSESECVELDYISEVERKNESYNYFRLNVMDLDGLNSKFVFSPNWTSDKEIYIIANMSQLSDFWVEELGERIQPFGIQFLINQFDENIAPTSSENTPDTNEVTVDNPGTVVVETDYYTLDIPREREDYCT